VHFPLSISLLLLVQIASPQTSPNAGWAGLYVGDNLHLDLKQTPIGLGATLVFEGKTYSATATISGAKLSGSFRADNASFPYEATRNGANLDFTTGGTTYRLLRQQPAGATTLFRHKFGFSLPLPLAWTATEAPEAALLLPPGAAFDTARQDNPEAYIAAMRDGYSAQDEAQTVAQLRDSVARNGVSGGRNGQREAAVFGSRNGAVYRWDMREPNTGRQIAFDIFLAAEGQRAFVVLAVGEPARIRARDAELRQILAGMSATQIQQQIQQSSAGGVLADNTPLAQRWLAKLRGRHVRQFWASQGMSSDKRHILAADGSYAFRSSSMVSVDVSGASALSTGGDNARGRWRILDSGGRVFLEVQYANGNVSRMPITENGQNWFLNGEKAFAVDPE
jgi:hypothetical protein